MGKLDPLVLALISVLFHISLGIQRESDSEDSDSERGEIDDTPASRYRLVRRICFNSFSGVPRNWHAYYMCKNNQKLCWWEVTPGTIGIFHAISLDRNRKLYIKSLWHPG